MSDEQLVVLLQTKPLRGIMHWLGYKSFDGRVFKYLKDKAAELSVELHTHEKSKAFDEATLRESIARNFSYIDVLRELGYTDHTCNYRTIQKHALKWNIDTSHFNQRQSKGNTSREVHSFDTIFVKNCEIHRSQIRGYALRHNIFDYECRECGISEEYNNKPITLELDHINGNCRDNRVSNLRWLCPNCHSQTDTHRNKKRVVLPPGNAPG